MTDADIIIWFATQAPARISKARLVAIFGAVMHRIAHLVQLGLLRRHDDHYNGTVTFTLVRYHDYHQKPWRKVA